MPHKLDPYKGIIDACLEVFPKLSAKRLFDEIHSAGHPGSWFPHTSGEAREDRSHSLRASVHDRALADGAAPRPPGRAMRA